MFNLLKNKEKSLKNNKEKSTGRSMVEMLGVLAIIGVLSIGGISGYTIAMRKYQANEILNIASKYAAIAWTKINQEKINDPTSYYWIRNDFTDVGLELPTDYTEKGHNSGYVLDSTKGNNYLSYVLAFSDSGLGGLPTGVQEMTLAGVSASKSGIVVTIEMRLTNEALCETLRGMVDHDQDFWYDGVCSIPYFGLGFPQN